MGLGEVGLGRGAGAIPPVAGAQPPRRQKDTALVSGLSSRRVVQVVPKVRRECGAGLRCRRPRTPLDMGLAVPVGHHTGSPAGVVHGPRATKPATACRHLIADVIQSHQADMEAWESSRRYP